MKAAVIGAGEEALHTIEKAHEYGLTVIALDGNPKAAGLKAADKAMAINISDEDVTIEALRQEKPDFVLTAPIGRYLTTTGAVNDALGLPGISREMADLCIDKFSFHKKLAEKSLRKCHCYAAGGSAITDMDGAVYRDAGEIQLGFPAILKPRYGSGSRGIYMLTGKEQLKEALGRVADEAYILEECMAGEEYGVDGAVTKEGFFMILLRKKDNTPPPARQAVGYFSVSPKDRFWQQAYDYMAGVIACLGLNECLLHADIIKGADGPFAIELSARPSGHNLHNLFTSLCTGVDMAEEYIRHRMGLSYSFAPRYTRSMMIHYFDMQGRVVSVPDRGSVEKAIDAELIAWECNMREGEMLTPVSDGHSVMGRGFFILEGKNDCHLREQAEIIKKMFGMEE